MSRRSPGPRWSRAACRAAPLPFRRGRPRGRLGAPTGVAWLRNKAARNKYVHFPAGAFPAPPHLRRNWSRVQAITPLIPIDLRPKRGLENYHVLWEAVWHPAPPVDPMLLRRIGEADLWVVLAAWDLGEVERAALAARIRV